MGIKLCPVCGQNRLTLYLQNIKKREIYYCQNCTNAITYPLDKVDYSNNQFFNVPQDEEAVYFSYARPILDLISIYKKKGKLLDIGCGGGFLIENAISRGFKASGIDISQSAVEYCQRKKLNVRQGSAEKNDLPKLAYDIVIASHVLEHSQNPHQFLRGCYKMLNHQGILVLSQTNFQGALAKILGKFWHGWVTNEHLFHFSPQGIKNLLEINNFKLIKIKIIPLGYRLMFKHKDMKEIVNSIYYSVGYLFSKLIIIFSLTGDQMYLLAKKI